MVQVRAEVNEAYATGMTKTIVSPLYAQFRPVGMLPLERELALNTFTFNGFYQQEDEVTIVPPDYRIGVFDSRDAQIEAGWSDADRITVEEELRRLATLYPANLCIVPEVRVAAPWPRYDEFAGSVRELMAKVIEDGYALEDVLAYEAENQSRPEVIGALEQLLEDGEPVPVEEVVG
jgi:hypothetical protein